MPFILTLIASLSTLLGSIPIYFKKSKNLIINSLAFAAGVMITVSITDLIPESYNLLINNHNLFETILLILIFINIGVIISMLIDKFLPSNNELYRVGIVNMLAIILHNIPEGIATYITSSNNITLGITLTIAITAHNIPEGIGIAIPIYYATNSKIKALLYTFLSGISEFFGAIISFIFLKDIINLNNLGFLFSIIAGIMIHISIYELIPTSLKYKKYFRTFISFIIGVLFILINFLIFH